MNAIAYAFNNAQTAQEKGITVGGAKYFFSKIGELDNIPVLHCAKVGWRFLMSHFLIPDGNANFILLLKCRAKKESSPPSAPSRFWFHITRRTPRLVKRLTLSRVKLRISSKTTCKPAVPRGIYRVFVEGTTLFAFALTVV